MIKIDDKVYVSLELAMPFFKAALRVEIYNEKTVTTLPDVPAATDVFFYNLPLVTALPDVPVAIYVRFCNLPLVKNRF
jgi:hypothetical protein